jgi:RHS repeat-associated protein
MLISSKTITEGNQRLYFTYGADDERVMTELVELDGSNETTLLKKYFFGLYEQESEGAAQRHIHYIMAGDGLTAIVVEENAERNTYFTYKDHLGSIVTLTDEEGDVFFEQNFDAWGKYRNPTDWTHNDIPEPPTWLRGYTGHEHLKQFDLINMNGRMYDPSIGRMLRPDNFVQEPTNSQSYNRYSYVWNNPLKYTDPDGEFVWVPMVIGAAIGGISGYFAGKANGMKGGDLAGYIFIGGVMGSVTGMMGGAITSSLGMNLPTNVAGIFAAGTGASISSAVSGGGFSVLSGRNMTEGMWKGAMTGLAGGLVGTSIGGAGGAFLGGATSGAVGTALNNGASDDILKSALYGGMLSLGAYQIQHAAAYAAYKKTGGEWTYNQHYRISAAAQRSFAWGKETGGWILDNGEVEFWKMIARDGINPTPKPSNAIDFFHSHPNWGRDWIEMHSPEDINFNNTYAYMSSFVIGRQNVWIQNPRFQPYIFFNNSQTYFNTYSYNFYGSMSLYH